MMVTKINGVEMSIVQTNPATALKIAACLLAHEVDNEVHLYPQDDGTVQVCSPDKVGLLAIYINMDDRFPHERGG
jgi:hypothetical protein